MEAWSGETSSKLVANFNRHLLDLLGVAVASGDVKCLKMSKVKQMSFLEAQIMNTAFASEICFTVKRQVKCGQFFSSSNLTVTE